MSGSFSGRQFVTGPITHATPISDGAPGNPGRNILLSCSADAEVTLTLANDGGTVTVYPQAGASGIGDNIYPFCVLQFHVLSGTIVSAYNLT